jgi:hypothetical protein
MRLIGAGPRALKGEFIGGSELLRLAPGRMQADLAATASKLLCETVLAGSCAPGIEDLSYLSRIRRN